MWTSFLYNPRCHRIHVHHYHVLLFIEILFLLNFSILNFYLIYIATIEKKNYIIWFKEVYWNLKRILFVLYALYIFYFIQFIVFLFNINSMISFVVLDRVNDFLEKSQCGQFFTYHVWNFITSFNYTDIKYILLVILERSQKEVPD